MRAHGRLRSRTLAAGLAIAFAATLTGCVDQSLADLQSYVQSVLARPGKPPEPLPPIQPYNIYSYSAADKTDPFQPFYVDTPSGAEDGTNASAGGITPDFNRNREELETHPLDALRMMGTLEKDGDVWGIVLDPGAVVHRVQVGNYIGKNHGKIVDISEESIALTEVVPDGQGGWVEREAALALYE